jgi:hypothetical protein
MAKKTSLASEEFIEERIRYFDEPERRGTPKGDPIGPGKVKYAASLFSAIFGYDLKEIAMGCGVSYGVLRKWRSEEPFKKLVEDHRQGFVLYWTDELFMNLLARREKEDEFLEGKEIEDVPSLPFHFPDTERFTDISDYHPELANKLVTKIDEMVREYGDEFLVRYGHVLCFFLNVWDRVKAEQYHERGDQYVKEKICQIIADTLRSPNPSETKRRHALVCVEMIRQHLQITKK